MDAEAQRTPRGLPLWAKLLTFKLAYFLICALVVLVWPDFDAQMYRSALAHWPRGSEPILASHFATWDAAHYLRLSEEGYEAGLSSCAFYPLWPISLRGGSWLFAGNHLFSGLVLANACSLIGWLCFHRIVSNRFGVSTANWALCLLIAYPGALFFQFIYSESVFFLLLMAIWFTIDQHQYKAAAVAAFLLPLCRAVGFLCLLPMLCHLILQRRPARDYVVVIGLLTGGLAYFGLMGLMTGNCLEGFAAQRFWQVNSIWNAFDLPKFLSAFIAPTAWHSYHGSVLDRLLFYGLILCLPAISRLDREWAIWSIVLGVIPAMLSSFVSYTRYSVMAVPVFVVVARWSHSPRWRALRWAILGSFAALHIILLYRHLNFRWAG